MKGRKRIRNKEKEIEMICKMINYKTPELIAVEKALDDMEKMLA